MYIFAPLSQSLFSRVYFSLSPLFSLLLAHPLFTISPVPFIYPSIYPSRTYIYAHTCAHPSRSVASLSLSLSPFFLFLSLSPSILSLAFARNTSREAPHRRPSSTPHPHQPHVALSASPWSYENYVTRSIRAFLVPLSFLIFLLWISQFCSPRRSSLSLPARPPPRCSSPPRCAVLPNIISGVPADLPADPERERETERQRERRRQADGEKEGEGVRESLLHDACPGIEQAH